jgi:acyl-coenzyme A thioesterase PaaI-like protein
VTDTIPNRLQRELRRLERLPAPLAAWLRRLIIGRTIPFVGTAGLHIDELTVERAVIRLGRSRRVMNHVQGPHAAATALLAETASGLAFGIHLPDDRLPLLKSMALNYLRRSDLPQSATAWLEPDQIRRLQTEERGEVTVSVRVDDELSTTDTPVSCQMIWAWIPRRPASAGTGGQRP